MGTADRYRVAEERVGRTVADRYRLLSLLGVGGMGAVYRAQHTYTDRPVALKILHSELSAAPGVAQRFLREAKASARIGHPGIVDVLDAGADPDGTLYLAFELLEGRDLAQALKTRSLSPRDLIRMAVDVLDALVVAHERGFVHRDIKPPNIFLLDRKGGDPAGPFETRLLDFGIARELPVRGGAKLTQAGTVLGTPYFMSPEQMSGDEVDGRADLWALGVVLYLALTGHLPYRGENLAGLLAEMLRTGAPSLAEARPDAPPRLCAVVDRSLLPRLEDRWSTARAMRAPLQALLEEDAPSRGTTGSGPTAPAPWNAALDALEAETAQKRGQSPRSEEPETPARGWRERLFFRKRKPT